MKYSVAVIMPYYKKRRFVYSSIKSFLNQKYKKKFLIIIYDDQDKRDLAYLQKITQKFKNIMILDNEKNLGAGESRNKALKLVRSEYIAFLDSDDLWHPNKLKEQIDFMKKNNINFSHTSYKIIDQRGKTIGYREAKSKLSYKSILKSCDIGLSTVVVKKNFLKNNRFAILKTKEDFVLWLQLLKKDDIYGLDRVLTSWRKLSNSLSSSSFQKLLDAFRVYFIYEKLSLIKSIYMILVLSFFYLIKVNSQNK